MILKVGIIMKLTYKLTALTLAGATVVTMGACTRKEEMPSLETPKDNKPSMAGEVNVPTTFSIFENVDDIIDSLEEPVTENHEELITEQKEDTMETKKSYPEIPVESRFTTQAELELFLKETYINSGKNIYQIIDELKQAQENGDFYAYRSDLVASAAYMLILENGYTLDELALKLDYLLTLCMYSREVSESDLKILKVLYDMVEKDGEYIVNIYQFFESLALERHRVSCPEKDKHEKGHRLVACPTLSEEALYELLTKNGLVLKLD